MRLADRQQHVLLTGIGSQPLPQLGGCVGSAPWNALAAMLASSLFAQAALSNCRDAPPHNVHDGAFSFHEGLEGSGVKFHIAKRQAVDMVHVACVKELVYRQDEQPFHCLDVSPGTCPSPLCSMLCTHLGTCVGQPALRVYTPHGLPKLVTQIPVSEASAMKVLLRFEVWQPQRAE